MTQRSLSILFAVLIGVSAVYGLNRMRTSDINDVDDSVLKSSSRELPVNVVVAKQVGSFQNARDFTGKIFARRTSDIGFKRGGKVVEVLVEEGQAVKKGQVIARLDVRELNSQMQQTESRLNAAMAQYLLLKNGPRAEVINAARANVRRMVAVSELQTRGLDRRKSLSMASAVSGEEVEQYEFNDAAFKAQLAAARAQLAELEAGTRKEEVEIQRAVLDQIVAEKDTVKIQIEDSELTAPFDGTIAKRFVDEGSVVTPASSIARVVEDELLEAKIGIPPVLAYNLRPGDEYDIACSGRTVTSILRCVLPEIDQRTQTRTAIFDIHTSGQLGPAVGEIARVSLNRTVQATGFWLSSEALSMMAIESSQLDFTDWRLFNPSSLSTANLLP